ncbi:hypothetical protein KBZ07_06555 [Cyanobium sp. BA20m-14]|nr:hypothetical protein [Cyanobium sp. BA20m-14]MCP9913066.1 hypothetical protein [Cyanobium sp. BA20m-14]
MSPEYFPIQKRWRQLRPLFEQEITIRLAHLEMEAYAQLPCVNYVGGRVA